MNIMDMNEIYKLMDRFESSSLSEISVETGDVKFSAKKGSPVMVQPFAVNEATMPAAVPAAQAAPVAKQKTQHTGKAVTAPLVGTFYRAPGPGEKPFVEKGQKIKKGDVVGIIEAMKLMNEITATEDGVITAIEAEDGVMVEYGEVLMRLE